eukprot:3497913-Prymnesium_polylepis.1
MAALAQLDRQATLACLVQVKPLGTLPLRRGVHSTRQLACRSPRPRRSLSRSLGPEAPHPQAR